MLTYLVSCKLKSSLFTALLLGGQDTAAECCHGEGHHTVDSDLVVEHQVGHADTAAVGVAEVGRGWVDWAGWRIVAGSLRPVACGFGGRVRRW